MKTRSTYDLKSQKLSEIIATNTEATLFRRKPRNILLFDLESFKLSDNFIKNSFNLNSFNSNSLNSKTNDVEKWLPHQFAWTIYKYCFSKKKLTPILERNYYVSEFWIDPLYRDEMAQTSNQSILNHLNELKKSRYPMKCGLDIIHEMNTNIKEYNIEYICAYNIASDFQAIKNLHRHLNLNSFDSNSINPFDTNYVDLMHNVTTMYKDYLIEEGFKDGKIFRNAKTKRIKLRGRDNTKSIYSVEYIAKKFFDKKQLHFASDDVLIEGMLLQKIIRDHGYYKLKQNSTYPSDIYRMFLQRIIENYHNKIETHYMLSDNPINENPKIEDSKNENPKDQNFIE